MHVQPSQISALLGLKDTNTLLELAELTEQGLPVESVRALARTFSPQEQNFLKSVFSLSTLQQGQKSGSLTAEESDMVVRLAATWLMARGTFGDTEKAQRFLTQEHPLLRGRPPLELAGASTAGAQSVEQLLGRLKYGSAA